MGIIKIITGKYKNIKINTIKKKNIKPMLSRIKLIFFQILKNRINNSICLDCFSGSGSLGIEAISNNAKHVTFIENDFYTFKNIKKNLLKYNIKTKIICQDVLIFLKNTKKKFDIIFIDPPLKYKKINLLINTIVKNQILNKNAFILIETLKKNYIKIPHNWLIIKEIKRKNIIYILYKIN